MVTVRPTSIQRLCTGAVAIAMAFSLFLLAGCGSSSSTPPADTPITVWVDATRLTAIRLYQKTHPAVKLNIVTADYGKLPEKVLLFNRSGSGWPDVVFTDPSGGQVVQLADSVHHFPADLTPYVPRNILNQFAAGALAPCTVEGKLYCLRNDIAQDVLWYNKKLMDQFGYQVPTTWEEYQALGLKVAKEHPGYVIGGFGGAGAVTTYLWASRCPVMEPVNATTVHINMSDPRCTRVANLLQPLLDAGSLSKRSPFNPEFVKLGQANKVLMLPGAAWYGEHVFKTTYKTPPGELAVAPPLKWANDDAIYTGVGGGGAWVMSSHCKNPQAAADLLIWLVTSSEYQATAPTFPAYLPVADAWGQSLATNKYYATNPYPVLRQAASYIYPKWGPVKFNPAPMFSSIVVNGVSHGQTIAQTLPALQKELTQLAQASGYTIQP